MWFKIPYKFSLQSMHKQKKYLGKTFFFWVDKLYNTFLCNLFQPDYFHSVVNLCLFISGADADIRHERIDLVTSCV